MVVNDERLEESRIQIQEKSKQRSATIGMVMVMEQANIPLDS
jgi:hypothetical protein